MIVISKTSKAYESIATCVKELTEGLVISTDPSIGSTSSMPGWAVYRAGVLIDSGIFEIPPHKSIPDRLCILHNHFRKLYIKYPPDVLVYEEIPAQRHGGGGNAWGHASLLKSVGAILSVPGPENYVGILPISWKKLTRPEYVKGDEADAVEIGHIVLGIARTIKDSKPSKGKKNG